MNSSLAFTGRQALAGAPWREICVGPMQVNNIAPEEVEAEVLRRKPVSTEPEVRKDKHFPDLSTIFFLIVLILMFLAQILFCLQEEMLFPFQQLFPLFLVSPTGKHFLKACFVNDHRARAKTGEPAGMSILPPASPIT